MPRRIYLRDIQMMAELIHESDIAGGNELGKITGVEAFRVFTKNEEFLCAYPSLMDVISCNNFVYFCMMSLIN